MVPCWHSMYKATLSKAAKINRVSREQRQWSRHTNRQTLRLVVDDHNLAKLYLNFIFSTSDSLSSLFEVSGAEVPPLYFEGPSQATGQATLRFHRPGKALHYSYSTFSKPPGYLVSSPSSWILQAVTGRSADQHCSIPFRHRKEQVLCLRSLVVSSIIIQFIEPHSDAATQRPHPIVLSMCTESGF